MAWIESHTVLLRHRKVLQLSASLNLPPVYIIGHLHALWHAVIEQQEDGDLTTWPDAMIATAAAYPGDASLFVHELQAQKLLDGKIIHDWLEYAGRYLTNKYRTSNPRKLKSILLKHKSVSSQTKVRLKSVFSQTTRPNQPDLTRPDHTIPEDTFDAFWKVYPNKTGKAYAKQCWTALRAKATIPCLEIIIEAIEKAKKSTKWLDNNGKYIPNPATWLNQGRWDDVIPVKPMTTMEAFLARGDQDDTRGIRQGMVTLDHATVGQGVPDTGTGPGRH